MSCLTICKIRRQDVSTVLCLRLYIFFPCRSLVSYSDGCGGQNKNLTIIGFYSELHRSTVYEVLDHKYLVRGHTFLENDTDFSQIEKQKKSAAVYLPEDWFRVVQDANQRKQLIVTEMKRVDVFHWKSYISARCKPLSNDTDGHQVKLRDIHWLNFNWGEDTDLRTRRNKMFLHPDEVWVCYGFSKDEPWKKIKIVSNIRLSSRTPDQLYNGKLNLAPAKVKDLKTMASKFIPEPQCKFYLRLKSSSYEDCLSDDEDSDT